MKKQDDRVEIVCVLDKSGSMEAIEEDARGAFNEFLKDRKAAPGKALLTLCLFDTNYNLLHEGKDIQDVPELTRQTYAPSGNTALLDALGRTIDEVSNRLDKAKSKPKKVIMAVVTDGLENSSREYNRTQILNKIEDRKKAGWEILFLSSDERAIQEAMSLGVQADRVAQFAPSAIGYSACYTAINDMIDSDKM